MSHCYRLLDTGNVIEPFYATLRLESLHFVHTRMLVGTGIKPKNVWELSSLAEVSASFEMEPV